MLCFNFKSATLQNERKTLTIQRISLLLKISNKYKTLSFYITNGSITENKIKQGCFLSKSNLAVFQKNKIVPKRFPFLIFLCAAAL